jgi:hypothetical protein
LSIGTLGHAYLVAELGGHWLHTAHAAESQTAKAEFDASLYAPRRKSGGGRVGDLWKAELSDSTVWIIADRFSTPQHRRRDAVAGAFGFLDGQNA